MTLREALNDYEWYAKLYVDVWEYVYLLWEDPNLSGVSEIYFLLTPWV